MHTCIVFFRRGLSSDESQAGEMETKPNDEVVSINTESHFRLEVGMVLGFKRYCYFQYQYGNLIVLPILLFQPFNINSPLEINEVTLYCTIRVPNIRIFLVIWKNSGLIIKDISYILFSQEKAIFIASDFKFPKMSITASVSHNWIHFILNQTQI